MTRAESIAVIREHWRVALGVTLAFVWFTYRLGVDLAAALLVLLVMVSKVHDLAEKLRVVTLGLAVTGKAMATVMEAHCESHAGQEAKVKEMKRPRGAEVMN